MAMRAPSITSRAARLAAGARRTATVSRAPTAGGVRGVVAAAAQRGTATTTTTTTTSIYAADARDDLKDGTPAAELISSIGTPAAAADADASRTIGAGATMGTGSNGRTATRTAPADADALRFTLDPSVSRWRNYGAAWSSGLTDNASTTTTSNTPSLREIVSKVGALASTARDAQAAAYWAYHASRFSFFVTQAAAGLVAHHTYENFVAATPNPLDALRGLLAGGSRTSSPSSSSSSSSSSSAAQGSKSAAITPLQRFIENGSSALANRLVEALGTWEQDLVLIQAGVYRMPWDMTLRSKQFNPLYLAGRTAAFMDEAVATLKRRIRDTPEPLWLQSRLYPQYYTKTFHYQSDGWLSDRSADIYEHSTEVLFVGRQDAMQRATLVPISQYVATKDGSGDGSGLRLLEVAAGTGRFHTFIKDNWPAMATVCSDLSPFYLQRARANLSEWKRLRQPSALLGGADGTGVEFAQMAAEALDAPDASFDIVTCVYLFHELPDAIRRRAAAEMFRVLKPGGLAVFTDSVQLGDRPEWDATMGNFGNFNEPYYRSYVEADIGAIFQEAGFVPQTKWVSSATKTLSFLKPSE